MQESYKQDTKISQFSLQSELMAIYEELGQKSVDIENIALRKLNIRQRLKQWRKICAGELTIEKETIQTYFSRSLVKQYILGNVEAKPIMLNFLKTINLAPKSLIPIQQFLTNHNSVKYLVDILEIIPCLVQQLPQECQLIFSYLITQIQQIAQIVENQQFRTKQLQRYVEIIRCLNTMVRIHSFQQTHKLFGILVLSVERCLKKYEIISKEMISQLYLLLVFVNPKLIQPQESVRLIHFLHALAILKGVKVLHRLLPLVESLKGVESKYQLSCVLSKVFELEFAAYNDKINAFDIIIQLFECGRSTYPHLQIMISHIIKNGGLWNLEGTIQRKFFIVKVVLKYVECVQILKQWPSFIEDALKNAGNLMIAYSSDSIELYLQKLYLQNNQDYDKWSEHWIKDYAKCVKTKDKSILKGLSDFINPVLVRLCPNPALAAKILGNIPQEELILISLIKSYREVGQITISNQDRAIYFSSQPHICISWPQLKDILSSSDWIAADKCLELIAHLSKPSELLKPREYELLVHFYRYSIKTSSSQFRQNFLMTTKMLIQKLRINYDSEIKASLKTQKSKQYYESIRQFIKELVAICFEQIYIDAIFEIAQPALQILNYIATFFLKPFHTKTSQTYKPTTILQSTSFYDFHNFQSLLACLHSSYEAIRNSASLLLHFYTNIDSTELLSQLWKQSLQHTNKLSIRQFQYASRIILFLGNNYPLILGVQLAEGKSQFFKVCWFLLDLLKKRWGVFVKSFSEQSEEWKDNLVHGLLTSLSYWLETLKNIGVDHHKQLRMFMVEFMDQMIKILVFSVQISSASVSTVMLDSMVPQDVKAMKVDCRGHFLEKHLQSSSMDEQQALENVGVVAFYLLTRQSGLVFQSIANLLNSPNSLDYLPIQSLTTLINTYFYALINLKHMGSVERISIGLQAMSKAIFSRNSPQLAKIPEKLLKKLMEFLKQGQFTNILRRSAGVPYAFTCLLKSEDIKRKSMIQSTVQDLLSLAKNINQQIEVRVHSINVLKKIFQDSDLKQDLEVYVSDGFICSIEGFSSESWGVRNSSLMLFSSLANRTMGLKPSLNLVQFFHKCPQMFGFATKSLKNLNLVQSINDGQKKDDEQKKKNNVMYPSLYPLVLILSRLLPFDLKEKKRTSTTGNSIKELRKEEIKVLLPLIERAGNNPNLMGRAMTAKAILPFLEISDILSYAMNVFRQFPSRSMNSCHFDLLRIYHLVESFYQLCASEQTESHIDDILRTLLAKVSYLVKIKCFPIQQLLLKIYDKLIRNNMKLFVTHPLFRKLILLVRQQCYQLMETVVYSTTNFIIPLDLAGSQMRLALISLILYIETVPSDISDNLTLSRFFSFLQANFTKNSSYALKCDSEVIDTFLEEVIALHYESDKLDSMRKIVGPFLKCLDVTNLSENTLGVIGQLAIRFQIQIDNPQYLVKTLQESANTKLQVSLFHYLLWLKWPIRDLLRSFSSPDSLEELRQCCVDYLKTQPVINRLDNLICLRLLEDEEPEIRRAAGVQISRCLGVYSSNDIVLKNHLLQNIDLEGLQDLLTLNSDYQIKKKNNAHQRIFCYDKPNKYRSDIQNITNFFKVNRTIKLKDIQAIFNKLQINSSFQNYSSDILNRNQYQFDNILRFIVTNPKHQKAQQMAKIHPKLQIIFKRITQMMQSQ